MSTFLELPFSSKRKSIAKNDTMEKNGVPLAEKNRSSVKSSKYASSSRKVNARNQTSVLSSADDLNEFSSIKKSTLMRRQSITEKNQLEQKQVLSNSEINRFKRQANDLVEVVNPAKNKNDLVLSSDSTETLLGVVKEYRRGDDIRRHGLSVRSKILFCGPPGCGKTLCAEVLAAEMKLPLVVAKLDTIIASHLGETASNLKQIFELVSERPAVLFLDEFDALGRARTDTSEHGEIRRVVNSLLMMIDRFQSKSILVAATNLEGSLDRAVWRRFDEVVIFGMPTIPQIKRLLAIKTKNFPSSFDIKSLASEFKGLSFSSVERVCINAIKETILANDDKLSKVSVLNSLAHEKKRFAIENR